MQVVVEVEDDHLVQQQEMVDWVVVVTLPVTLRLLVVLEHMQLVGEVVQVHFLEMHLVDMVSVLLVVPVS
jgi:hypothetical protein